MTVVTYRRDIATIQDVLIINMHCAHYKHAPVHDQPLQTSNGRDISLRFRDKSRRRDISGNQIRKIL